MCVGRSRFVSLVALLVCVCLWRVGMLVLSLVVIRSEASDGVSSEQHKLSPALQKAVLHVLCVSWPLEFAMMVHVFTLCVAHV